MLRGTTLGSILANLVGNALKYAPPRATSYSYPMAAVPGRTRRMPLGPWVMPGTYTVRLTTGGTTLERPLTVRMDPRVKTSDADLQLQFDLSQALYRRIEATANQPDLAREHRQLLSVYGMLQEVDVRPTTQLVETARALLR